MAEGTTSQINTKGVRDEVNVCQLCGALENLLLCAGCRGTWYCSKTHQRQDWKDHKPLCKSKQKAVKVGDIDTFNSKQELSNEHKTTQELFLNGATDTQNTVYDLSASRDSNFVLDLYSTVSESSPNGTDSSSEEINTFSSDSPGAESDSVSSFDGSKHKLKPGVKNSKSSKKKIKFEQLLNLPTISEDGPPLERYYIDKSTHELSLPPFAQSQAAPATVMGVGDASQSSSQSMDQYLTILRARFKEIGAYAYRCLLKFGICVIDKFLGDARGQEILKEVMQLHNAGIMRQGQLVHGPTSSRNKYIRGDMITWVDGTEPRCENIHFLISCMDAVMLQCASAMENYTINERTKAMVACYPGRRTRYVRHVDNPNGDGRCVTCIYYLNQDWDVRQHGGLLRIFPEGEDRVANIPPKFDRLIFFWSDRRNPHEVEQAFRERYAVTVWYYDAVERAEALKKFKGSSQGTMSKRQAVPLQPNPNLPS